MLKDGLYTRWPNRITSLGFHDDAEIETGQIGVTEGYTYANVDSVDVTVRGMGGHGAYPHKTKDPIVLCRGNHQRLADDCVSRENNPLDPIVVTVGSIHGGTKHNIISDEVKMQLTVRTYKEVRARDALAAIERIAKGMRDGGRVARQIEMPEVSVLQGRDLTRDLQQSGTDQATSSRLERTRSARQRRFVKIRPWAARIFPNTVCRTIRFPAFMFNVGAVDPAKVAE